MEPNPTTEWNEVTWYPKTLAVLLFVILVCGAFYFGTWYQEQYQQAPSQNASRDHVTTEIVPAKMSSQNRHEPIKVSTGYKLAAFQGEVPSNWSVFHGPDSSSSPAKDLQSLTSVSRLFASFALNAISFGDGAFEQVDFHFITKEAMQSLLGEAHKNNFQVTREIIGGVSTTVIHYPTDNGQINKNGSGGKDYILGTGKSPSGYDQFLLMRDWSQGESEFETGFQHFLQTANFIVGW